MSMAVFPGGSKARCSSCRAEWLELEGNGRLGGSEETSAPQAGAVAVPVEERHKRPPPAR
jgi:hypothetical protein